MHEHYDQFMKKMKLYRIGELKSIAQLRPHEKVLDLGAGTGFIAAQLIDEYGEIHLLDESRNMLSHAIDNEKIKKCVGNALDIPYDDEFFHVIIISDVIHHIENQEELLKECKRVLKNEGRIIIHDFNRKYIKTKLLGIFERILFGKMHYLSFRETEKLLYSRGFKITNVNNKGYYFMISGEKI